MAGSRSLGTLTLDLAVKTGAFAAGMSKAERSAKQSTDRISGLAKGLGSALGLSLAGVAAGIAASIKGAIDRMDELRDASIRLGVGVETLSAYSYAAQQTGTDIETLGRGFKILAKNIADASEGKGKAKLFEALGVSIKDAQGNLRALDDVFLQISDRLSGMQDGTQKAAVLLDLFGKAGLDLTEIVNQGSAGLRNMTEEAKELGLVFDQEAADKADKFNDEMSKLKGSVTGLATDVAIELLPALTEMATWAKDWVSDGDNAKKTAGEIARAIGDIADAISAVGSVLGAFDSFKNYLSDIQQFLVEWNPGTSLRKRIQESLFGRSGEWNLGGFVDDFSGVKGGVSGSGTIVDFSKVQGKMSGGYDSKAVNRALGDYKPPKEKKGKTGKTEAEKEAERLAKAINKMTDAQREWQTELDGTGNQVADEYAKRLAEITEQSEDFIENGISKEKVAEFREKMTKLAEALKTKETAEYLKEFGFQTQEMIASANGASTASIQYARAIDELDKALKSAIISQDEYKKRADALAQVRDAASLQVLRDIKDEQASLGLTIEQQDTLNKLRYAGVAANSEYGQSIIAANEALHEQARLTAAQIEIMDEFRSGLSDAFVDFISGAKSAKEAFSDFFEDLSKKLLRMIVERWIERAFGEMGSSSGGGWGGAIAAGAAAIFGSGKAAGGPVMPGMLYPVNENKPEMLSMGGRDFLMMGNKQGTVKPARETTQRSGDTYVSNFNFHGSNETASRDQALALQDYEQRRVRVRGRNY